MTSLGYIVLIGFWDNIIQRFGHFSYTNSTTFVFKMNQISEKI